MQSEKSWYNILRRTTDEDGTRIASFGFNTIRTMDGAWCLLLFGDKTRTLTFHCRMNKNISRWFMLMRVKDEQHNDSDGRRTDKQTFPIIPFLRFLCRIYYLYSPTKSSFWQNPYQKSHVEPSPQKNSVAGANSLVVTNSRLHPAFKNSCLQNANLIKQHNKSHNNSK